MFMFSPKTPENAENGSVLIKVLIKSKIFVQERRSFLPLSTVKFCLLLLNLYKFFLNIFIKTTKKGRRSASFFYISMGFFFIPLSDCSSLYARYSSRELKPSFFISSIACISISTFFLSCAGGFSSVGSS